MGNQPSTERYSLGLACAEWHRGLKELRMSLNIRNKIIASSCAAALLVSSSMASAAAPKTVDPWLALSAMSSSSATVASTAAVQSDSAYRSNFRSPPWASLAVILATLALAIYLLVDDDDDDEVVVPISPN